VKYEAIAACVAEYPVALMCRVLGVAPSGYYSWGQRPVSARAQRDAALSVHVRAAFQASKGRYGSPRVHAELHPEHGIGRKRVARLMRAGGLRARPRRRYVVTTQSRHQHRIAPNLVARKFDVTSPNQVWVSDLTYLRTTTASPTWPSSSTCTRGASSAGRSLTTQTRAWCSRRFVEGWRCEAPRPA
jgi:putative transposase